MKRSAIVGAFSISLLSAFLSMLSSMAASAQSPIGSVPASLTPGLAPVPFNFGPPGARSLGMGGAFIGIADDATASESNPAGLTILTRPEISLHGRSASSEVVVEDVAALSAVETAQTFRAENMLPPLAAEPNTQSTFDESVSSVSFGSYVHPFQRWVLSVYYLENLNFEGDDSFAFTDQGVAPGFFEERYRTRAVLDSKLSHVGASAAFKIGKMVSVGASVRQTTFELVSLTRFELDVNDLTGVFGGGTIIDFDQQSLLDDEDEDVTYNVGVLFNPSGTVSVGLVFKEGGEFDIGGAFASDALVLGEPFEDPIRQNLNSVQEIPDTFGAGLAWRATDQLTVAADVVRVTYSDLDFSDLMFTPGTGAVVEEIDDEIEFHLGVEYQFLPGQGLNPVSLRAGFWTDPDHDGFATVDSDQEHVAVGVGFVVKQDFLVDLAGHFADTVDEALLSLVYRF